MRERTTGKRCTVDGCGGPAVYAFLAVTGAQADRIVDADGNRIRVCKAHLFTAVDAITAAFKKLPDGGPARIRAVPLTV